MGVNGEGIADLEIDIGEEVVAITGGGQATLAAAIAFEVIAAAAAVLVGDGLRAGAEAYRRQVTEAEGANAAVGQEHQVVKGLYGRYGQAAEGVFRGSDLRGTDQLRAGGAGLVGEATAVE